MSNLLEFIPLVIIFVLIGIVTKQGIAIAKRKNYWHNKK